MAERSDLRLTQATPETDDERSAEAIRQDIAARRESISRTVEQINDKVQSKLDWRTYASDYPLVAIGVAVGAGVLVSRLWRPKPTPGERILDAIAESVEQVADRFDGYVQDAAPRRRGGASTAVKSAIAAWLTKAATDYVKERVLPSVTAALAERRRAEQPDAEAEEARQARHAVIG